MLMLREVRATGVVSFNLSGDPEDMRRLGTVGNAQLAGRVRHAVRTSALVAGRSVISVSFHSGESGVPHALVEAAQGAGVELDRVTQEIGSEGVRAPEAEQDRSR